MASDYIRMVEKQARKKLEKLNSQQQKAIFQAYYDAGKQLVKGYKTAKGPATQALYASYIKKIAEETEQIIQEYALKGAAVCPEMEKLIMLKAFQTAGLDTTLLNDTFDNAIGKLGLQSVKNVIGGGIYKDGAGLSARIWGAATKAGNDIQEIIAAGLAQDMSAAKLSKSLEAYVDPSVRRTWDNEKIRSILGDGYATWNMSLEYNALRLARTTLSHTATMSMRQARKVNPYATKIKWHSVHAAGRTCSTCEEMDGNIYDTDKCPFDHPNGMCYQTHEFDKSLEEIADELAAWCKGEPNEMLDGWWKSIGGEVDEKPKFLGKLLAEEYFERVKSAALNFHKDPSVANLGMITPEQAKEVGLSDDLYLNMSLSNLQLRSATGNDLIMQAMIKDTEYSQLPKKLTSSEFDKLCETRGYTYVVRGVSDAQYVDKFKTGPLWCGQGLYGNGTYTAYGSGAQAVADSYGKASIEMIVDKDANIITYKDLVNMRDTDTSGKSMSMIDNVIYGDLGRYAIMKGYDAIQYEASEFMIVLNRSKIFVR